MLGPLVGGGLVDLNLAGTSWRAIFLVNIPLVNIPLGLIALGLGRRYLLPTAAATPDHRFDVLSVLMSVGAGFCLIFPLIPGRHDDWPVACWPAPGP